MECSNRQLIKIVKEICQEHGITFQGFSSDWVIQLTANDHTMFIHGYKFPNNNAAIEQICNDKSALSDLLSAHRIPHVPHSYFSSPYNKQNPPPQDNWKRMQSLLQEYGKIVCKPNAATEDTAYSKFHHKENWNSLRRRFFLPQRPCPYHLTEKFRRNIGLLS